MLTTHIARTLGRITELPIVLVAEDTTEFDLSHLPATQGLGYVSSALALRGFLRCTASSDKTSDLMDAEIVGKPQGSAGGYLPYTNSSLSLHRILHIGSLNEQITDPATNYECHCCGGLDTSFVQHYVLRRSLAVAPLYECRWCGSVSVDQVAVSRHYPRSRSEDAIAFHKRVRERNRQWAAQLLDRVQAMRSNLPVEHVVDIGCGIGTLLSVAADRGAHAIGYEIEPLALAEARHDTRLEMHGQPFSRASEPHVGALVCCIAVLEHLYRPLNLIVEIAGYCHTTGSSAFLFVPLPPNDWRPYLFESVMASGNPFFDNEEHVTHFTARRFADACEAAFGRRLSPLTAGGWAGLFYKGTAR